MLLDIKRLQELQDFSKDLKVLYVEDNKEARDSTYDTLGEFFDNITVAVDGVEGLEQFRNNQFDLIITDINMPRLNGIDMISKIRETNKDIAILIVSAYNESGYFMETIRLGVEGYLLKPIELDQFISMLSKTIEKIKMRKDLQEYQKNLEKKVQEQLLQIQEQNDFIKNREKFAAMGEMIDAITHQFKQPLGIMRLRTDEIKYLLKKGHFDIDKSLESINNQIEFSANTIDEFRNFFRNNPNTEKLNINEIFNPVIRLIKDELVKYDIEVKIDADCSLNITVNPSEFKHVLLNLINNAKYTLNERNIKNKQIFLTAKKIEDMVYICIEDNAGGISEDIIEKIFEPNFTTKPVDEGTGIGLHISKMILEKANASIEAQNSDMGAKFTIKMKNS